MLNTIKDFGICAFLFCIVASLSVDVSFLYFSIVGVVIFLVSDYYLQLKIEQNTLELREEETKRIVDLVSIVDDGFSKLEKTLDANSDKHLNYLCNLEQKAVELREEDTKRIVDLVSLVDDGFSKLEKTLDANNEKQLKNLSNLDQLPQILDKLTPLEFIQPLLGETILKLSTKSDENFASLLNTFTQFHNEEVCYLSNLNEMSEFLVKMKGVISSLISNQNSMNDSSVQLVKGLNVLSEDNKELLSKNTIFFKDMKEIVDECLKSFEQHHIQSLDTISIDNKSHNDKSEGILVELNNIVVDVVDSISSSVDDMTDSNAITLDKTKSLIEELTDSNNESLDSIKEIIECQKELLETSNETLDEKYNLILEEQKELQTELSKTFLQQCEENLKHIKEHKDIFTSLDHTFASTMAKLPESLDNSLRTFEGTIHTNLRRNNEVLNETLTKLSQIMGESAMKQKEFENIHAHDLKLLRKYL